MPKPNEKEKNRKRPKSNATDSRSRKPNENEENHEPKKRKVQKKPSLSDVIEKSKSLSQKLKSSRPKRSTNKTNTAPRICGNGKPMPSLAELELMYADSQDESDNDNPAPKPSTTSTPRPSTPSSSLRIPEDKLMSPTTLKIIASKVEAIIEERIDSILDINTTPRPVIPPKKKKKSGIPYIVGCKERKQVPWAPAKNSFCVGDTEYGVDENDNEPEPEEDKCCPKKRCKRSSKLNISKSIFNAKSDEIAARLQDCDNGSPCSSESNSTVDYDYMKALYAPRPFSPLPSTSKDNKTILKNEQLFNESLNCEYKYNTVSNVESNHSQNDLEIIETPVDTITINDSVTDITPEPKRDNKMNIEDDELCIIWPVNNSPISSLSRANFINDDSCIVIEPDIITSNTANNTTNAMESIEMKDEIYGSLDLTQTYDTDICEIIDLDVDDVIAESNAILEKYKKNTISEVTTIVEPVCKTTKTTGPSSTTAEISNGTIPNNLNIPSAGLNTDDNILSTLPNQPSTSQSSNSLNMPRPSISDVVINFFKPNNSANTSQIVDLTSTVQNPPTSSVPGRLMEVFDSMMSVLHNFSRVSESLPVVHEQITPNSPSQSPIVRNVTNINRNTDSGASTSNIDYMQFLRRKPAKSRKSNKKVPTPAAQAAKTTSALVQEPENNNSTTARNLGDCPICMENLSKSAVASTLCGHIFCLDCIKAAIRSNGKKCPNCRKALKGVGYHQIYI